MNNLVFGVFFIFLTLTINLSFGQVGSYNPKEPYIINDSIFTTVIKSVLPSDNEKKYKKSVFILSIYYTKKGKVKKAKLIHKLGLPLPKSSSSKIEKKIKKRIIVCFPERYLSKPRKKRYIKIIFPLKYLYE